MHKHSGIWPTLAVGLIVGAAAGAVATGRAGERSRRKVKRQAERAMDAMGTFARDLAEMVRHPGM